MLTTIRKAMAAAAGTEALAVGLTTEAAQAGSLPTEPLNLAVYLIIVHVLAPLAIGWLTWRVPNQE